MPDNRTIEDRQHALLEKLEDPSLSATEIEKIEKKLEILAQQKK